MLLYYMNYRKITAQFDKFTLFLTCSKSQDTLPLISPKICNHHWKSLTLVYLATTEHCMCEGPFMALVWCEIFGWSLTVSRCLAAGQWDTENQRDTALTLTEMHGKLWSVPTHYSHAPDCAWQLSVCTTHTVIKPLATLSGHILEDYA